MYKEFKEYFIYDDTSIYRLNFSGYCSLQPNGWLIFDSLRNEGGAHHIQIFFFQRQIIFPWILFRD